MGIAGLPLELPVSTTLMLRSILDIARSEGLDVRDPAIQLECLIVFALGDTRQPDNLAEAGYLAIRTALARTVSEAAQYLARRGLVSEGAPVLVRLLTQIASRFSATVTEKVAAQAVPVLGATGGALINALFLDHFQTKARGHFIVKRLEQTYGWPAVRAAYEEGAQAV
jgi:hypothetical protein